MFSKFEWWWFVINSILFLFVINVASFLAKQKLFNDDNTKDLFKNWESKPIYEIDILNDSKKSISIGEFKGIKKKIKKHSFYFWEGKTFNFIYNNNLKYKDLFNKENGKQCGYDNKKNKLFFPNEIDCPINYLEITSNKNPSMNNLSFTTLKLNDLKYIHYTNQYIEGEILINFQIGTNNGICEYKNYDDLSTYFNNYNIKYKECKNDLYDDSYTIIDNMSIDKIFTSK